MKHYAITLVATIPSMYDNILKRLYYYTHNLRWQHEDIANPEQWRLPNKEDSQKWFDGFTREGLLRDIPALEFASRIELNFVCVTFYNFEDLEEPYNISMTELGNRSL